MVQNSKQWQSRVRARGFQVVFGLERRHEHVTIAQWVEGGDGKRLAPSQSAEGRDKT
jgi:hypothetical protein